MKKKHFLLTIIIALVETSCASDGHSYIGGKCVTCWNNPLTNEPVNHDGKENLRITESETLTNQSISNSENKINSYPSKFRFSFTVPINVDVAFIKLKKEFNYYSEQEIRQEWGGMASAKMQTFAYAYSATPSVHYKMRANRQHQGVFAIIDSEIEMQENSKSKITISYWVNKKSVNYALYSESLKKRAQNALII